MVGSSGVKKGFALAWESRPASPLYDALGTMGGVRNGCKDILVLGSCFPREWIIGFRSMILSATCKVRMGEAGNVRYCTCLVHAIAC